MSDQILQRVLQSPRLPSLPTIAIEVIDLVQQRDVNIKQIARTIQHDPALAGKILKTVNSSFYGQAHSVSTVSNALVVLGLNSVKTLALGFSLVGNLSKAGGHGIDHVSYWKRSLYTATAAKSLARRAGLVQQEEAFLGGLLQDLGVLAMSQALGDEYTGVLAAEGGRHRTLSRRELDAFGIDHAAVGAALAESWKLPPLLTAPIRFHESPDDAPEEVLPLVRAVSLGNDVADVFATEGVDAGEPIESYYRLAEDWFDIPREQSEPLLTDIHSQTKEMRRLFELPTGPLGNPDEVLAKANEALLNLSIQAQQQSTQLEQQNRRLESEANTDALTGVANRRAFDQAVASAFNAASVRRPMSVLFLDIDHFKKFNDTHGHAVGDAVLVAFAKTMAATVGDAGTVYRYGGEEFAVVCPTLDRTAAARLAEQVRTDIAAKARTRNAAGEELSITASIGVACHDGSFFRKPEQVVKAADQGVYAAKDAGRNSVRVFAPRRVRRSAA